MHELLAVWTHTKGVQLIAVNALVYALLLIPFNQLNRVMAGIPVRPAAAIPVVCGIQFGPAAAWGLGIGNIAGDLFGSWSPMRIMSFFHQHGIPVFRVPVVAHARDLFSDSVYPTPFQIG
jgi:energy-coupling factor transport system substrate-specific component